MEGNSAFKGTPSDMCCNTGGLGDVAQSITAPTQKTHAAGFHVSEGPREVEGGCRGRGREGLVFVGTELLLGAVKPSGNRFGGGIHTAL